MRRKEEDRFIGMWKHKTGGWEIKYQQGGKKISEYRRDKKEAELRAQYWKATLEQPRSDIDEEHPIIYWEKTLRRVAELSLSNPNNRDISATCRAIASAATAAIRTARYMPAPGVEVSPDGAPVQGEIGNLRTEDLEKLAGGE